MFNLTLSGFGPFSGILQTCILGNPPAIAAQALEKAEEGAVDSTTSTKEPATSSNTTLWRGLQLCGCIVGLQISYVTWGVIQVQHRHTL